MSSVVSFLTMLERDVTESNGNVRRMLSVCAEFERIAKVVLDKAELDMRSGRSGKRKAAGGPNGPATNHQHHTQREVEKAMRDRGVAEVALAAGLDEGKTLEQMQVETQAAYRRPVQTPSLRASVAGSQVGSGAGNSPASWAGSQPGGTGPEYKSPPQRWQPSVMQTSTGQWNVDLKAGGQGNAAFSMLPDASAYFAGAGDQTNGHAHPGHLERPARPPQQLPPADFTQPQANLTDGYEPHGGTNGFSLANATTMPEYPDPNSLLMNGNGFDPGPNVGSFQQPFVPQDLWQMPMTLEWDWAEGLGLGSFTPGMMGNYGPGAPGFMGDLGDDSAGSGLAGQQ